MSDEPAEGGGTKPEEGTAGEADDVHLIDLVADELTLARAQLDAGLPALAEGTVLRRLAWLEADGATPSDETDALRALLAEALWRQQRNAAARRAIDAIRPSSPQRRLPITGVIEADVLAAAGERDRAAGAAERVIDAIGADAAFAIRGGQPGPLAWPLPAELRAEPTRPARPPWSAPEPPPIEEPAPDDDRVAAGRARLEQARVAYVAGDLERGDVEMSIAMRLDAALAADGISILEPTLGARPAAERLLLYGDLLRAAGRQAEADEAYDRAAAHRS
ncbi:MAG TPA: hypothetical protein VLA76_00875 [Candidatus Angelobacter sp.]|nr:hypothetical protein [Candidatus Angelobacter sp.]